MNHNKLFLDPLAAEKPKNYSLLFAFNFQNPNDQKEIENIITLYASKNNIQFEYLNE